MQFDYFLRMIPPNISESYAKQFDALVREAAVNDAMDIDDVASSDTPQHELAMKQLYMPIAMGGGGLHEQMTADTLLSSQHILVLWLNYRFNGQRLTASIVSPILSCWTL